MDQDSRAEARDRTAYFDETWTADAPWFDPVWVLDHPDFPLDRRLADAAQITVANHE